MADANKPLSVTPMEEVVLGGFAERMQQVFGCVFVLTNEHEKVKAIARMFEGKPVKYPYGFIKVTSLDTSTQTYNPHYFLRHGIETFVKSERQLYAVRCMPATIEVEVEYHTNVFLNSRRVNPTEDPSLSVLAFMRRWAMAARGGWTKSTINYGQLSFGINVIMSPSISAPEKGNQVEDEAVYKVTATAQIQGWISEPILKQAGIVHEVRVGVNVESAMANATQPISLGKVFIPRPARTNNS